MFKLILQQKNLLISSLLNESWAWNNQLEMEQKLLNAKKLVERYNTDKKFKEETLNSSTKFREYNNAKDLLEQQDKPKALEVVTQKQSTTLKQQSIDDVKEQFELNTQALTSKVDNWGTLTVEESNKLKEAVALAERQIWEIEEKSNYKNIVNKEIVAETKKMVNHAREVSLKFTSQKTAENNTSLDSTFRGKETRSEYIKSLSPETQKSLESILKSPNFEQNALKLVNELYSWKYDKGENVELTPANNDLLEKMLLDMGYKFDNYFTSPEINAVILTMKNLLNAQINVSNLSNEEKIKLLLDFDSDGQLTNTKNFSVWELQSFYVALSSAGSEWSNELIKNLWLWNLESFSNEMSKNLYLSRERFQRQLSSMVNSRVSLAELCSKDWVKKSYESMYQKEVVVSKEVWEEIDKSKQLDEKLDAVSLTQAQKQEVKKILKLEAIWAIVWDKNWAWASFDVKEFTKNFVDSVWFWMIDWTPGIMIKKEVYAKNWVSANVWLANVIIPMASLSYTLERKPELKWLFNKSVEWKIQPTIYWTISTLWWSIWVNFENLDEDTKAWVDAMVNSMKTNLQVIKWDLLAWKDFKDSAFAKLSVDKLNDEAIYNDMLNSFKPLMNSSAKESALNSMMVWYLEYYKTELYKNAEWLKLTSVWGWVALVAGFLPLPYLTLGWEYNTLEYSQVKDRYKEQATNTTREINPLNVGLSYEQVDWKNVYSIQTPTQGTIDFSSPNGQLNVLRQNWKIYFSWDIKDIKIVDETVQDTNIRHVLINWGVQDEKWNFKASKEIPTLVNTKENILRTSKLETSNLSDLNSEAIEKTFLARQDLFNIIEKDAVNSNDTPRMQELQKMIFDQANWKDISLNQIWEQFNLVINDPKFINYAKTKNASDSLMNLKIFLSNPLTNAEKTLILQSVPACLMKKWDLRVDDKWTVNVNKSISEHDKRAKFFDKIFTKETRDILPEVQQARKEWFAANGHQTKYNFRDVSDWTIAFSATQIKNSQYWLMPYIWAYHIADAGKPYIDITKKSPDLIDNIPQSYLLSILESLQNNNNLKLNSVSELKLLLKWQELNGVKLNYDLKFAKMWECLNDAIILTNLVVTSTKDYVNNIQAASLTSANTSMLDSLNIWVAWTWKKQERNPENDKSTAETKPDDWQIWWDTTPQAPTTTPDVQTPTVEHNWPTWPTTPTDTAWDFN